MARRPIAVIMALSAMLPSLRPCAAEVFRPKANRPSLDDIEQAVSRGVAWLKTAPSPDSHRDLSSDELILYGLVVGKLPTNDPALAGYLRKVVDKPPARTYAASIAALALAEIDEAGYRWKLEEIALFLVNTQCRNGLWGYGEALPSALRAAAGPPPTEPSRPAAERPFGPPPPYGIRHFAGRPDARRVAIRQLRREQGEGDNSNSQYAALGLLACWKAGIDPDPACLRDALAGWERSACADGSWTYTWDRTGTTGDRSGWCSMTAGGVASLVIHRTLLGLPWRQERRVESGLGWLARNWDITSNAGANKPGTAAHHYYALHSLERAGTICGIRHIGLHDWYEEGAAYLLERQRGDGSWKGAHGNEVHDTCFAILFLQRSIRTLGWMIVDYLGKFPSRGEYRW